MKLNQLLGKNEKYWLFLVLIKLTLLILVLWKNYYLYYLFACFRFQFYRRCILGLKLVQEWQSQPWGLIIIIQLIRLKPNANTNIPVKGVGSSPA